MTALLSQYQDDGTMGKAPSTASSGGVDWYAGSGRMDVRYQKHAGRREDAAAAAVIAAAQSTPIHANIKEVNDTTIDGAGTAGDPWGRHNQGEPEWNNGLFVTKNTGL